MLKEKFSVIQRGCNWAIQNTETKEFVFFLKSTNEYGYQKSLYELAKQDKRLHVDRLLFGYYDKVSAVKFCEKLNRNEIKLL